MNTRAGVDPSRIQPIILAGGLGTRLRPRTDVLPKPLLPVQGRPLLWYAFNALEGGGLRRPIVVVDYLAELIEAYFEPFPAEFRKLPQVTMAEAVLTVAESCDADAFLGLSADVLIGPNAVDRVVTAFSTAPELDTVLFVRLPKAGHKHWDVAITDDGYLKDLTRRETQTSLERLLLILRADSLRLLRGTLPTPIVESGLPEAMRSFQSGWMLLIKGLLKLGVPVRAEVVDVPVQNVNVPSDFVAAEEFVRANIPSA